MTKLKEKFVKLFVIILIFASLAEAELVHTVSGVVGGGNSSFYKVTLNEAVIIELITMVGDSDLYVSDLTQQPSWDEFEAMSATCGVDSVVIPRLITPFSKRPPEPKSANQGDDFNAADYYDPLLDSVGWSPIESLGKAYKRPVYIGVYGHPGFDVSKFQLNLHILDDYDIKRYYDSTPQDGGESYSGDEGESDGEGSSRLWEFIAAVLRILLELII